MKIHLRLAGGFGNQLFQFSAAWRLLKLSSSNSLFIHPFYLSTYSTKRPFCLNSLVSHPNNVFLIENSSLIHSFLFKYRPYKVFPFPKIFLQSSADIFAFEQRSSQIKRPSIYLDGYFHDFNIPTDQVSNYILHSLSSSVALPFTPASRSVAIHIRRGDYLDSSNASIYKCLDTDYYDKAYSLFDPNSNFYIFSDDPNTSSFYANRYSGVDMSSYSLSMLQEFYIMSLCHNFIIANSTFSWWASRLSPNALKTIVAPRSWFFKNSPSSHLLHPDFTLLD